MVLYHTIPYHIISYHILFRTTVPMGKKNRNVVSPNSEGVRRGAVGARSFNAAIGGLGERCKQLLQRVRAKRGRQTRFGAFLV